MERARKVEINRQSYELAVEDIVALEQEYSVNRASFGSVFGLACSVLYLGICND